MSRRSSAHARLGIAVALDGFAVAAVLLALASAPGEHRVVRAAAPATRAPVSAAPTVRPSPTPPVTAPPTAAVTPTPGPPLRDVYYLVIEEYANREILAREYGFDNTTFLDALRKRGFVVPSRVRGPYPKTPHSI